MHIALPLDWKSVIFFVSFYDLGLKRGGPCPESRVCLLSESDNIYVNGEKFGTG